MRSADDEINIILDLACEFSKAIEKYNLPDDVSLLVAEIVAHCASVIKVTADDYNDVEKSLLLSADTIERLANKIRTLEDENKELKIFVEAAKKFPGFQC